MSFDGHFGQYGGRFVPEALIPALDELAAAFEAAKVDPDFQAELDHLHKTYSGRPSILTDAKRFSEYCGGARILLKLEDLNHTGSHKINNVLGQALLTKRMGKPRIIAETGAGQHGVATATVCAKFGLSCKVFMGEKDIERQAPNVQRMKFLGAEVIAATSGSRTLKDATNEAIRHWINHPESYYLIGSVVGPHPYPELVAHFQSVISREIQAQLVQKTGKKNPTKVIACVGGGSNAAGAFASFYDCNEVELIAAEAAGLGIDSGHSAATSVLGTTGIIHGSQTLLMQDQYGQIIEPYSISAGLDYPGIGPLHAHMIKTGRTSVVPVSDQEALDAARELTRHEGIIPALESAHALAVLKRINIQEDDIIVINLSGRGDKDLSTYITAHFNESL